MNIFKKVFIVVFVVAILLTVAPMVSKADTVSNLQAQIAALLAQIATLQAQLQQQQLQGGQWCHVFATNLKVGDRGGEVLALSQALIKNGIRTTGQITSEFDESLAADVVEFQEKYRSEVLDPSGLRRGTGFVGALTRAKLNALFVCGGSGGGGGGGVICPAFSPPSPEYCKNGTLVSGGTDSNGCQRPPKCIEKPPKVRCPVVALPFCANNGIPEPYDDKNGCPNYRCESFATGPYDSFAKCLAKKSVVLYGAKWCSHCQNEIKAFGNSFKYVSYVECPENQDKCNALNITSYPTWTLDDGKRLVGEQGLEKLSQETGCALKDDTAVIIPPPVIVPPVITPPVVSTDGEGGLSAWTTSRNYLPAARFNHDAVIVNGYMYVVGGGMNRVPNDTPNDNVYYTKLNADGTTGVWNTTTALPSARFYHTTVANNGYIYIVGGYNRGAQNTVYYGKVNSDGTISAWNTTSVLPRGLYMHASLISNGYVYATGGNPNLSTVYYASINADGTLGMWQRGTDFKSYPGVRYHSLVADNGYVYIVGGYNASSMMSDVYYGRQNYDGSITDWKTTTAMPRDLGAQVAGVANGYLYVIGGKETSGAVKSTVYYSKINSDGTLGSWVLDPKALPVNLFNHAFVASKCYFYVLGGDDMTNVYSTIFYTPFSKDLSYGKCAYEFPVVVPPPVVVNRQKGFCYMRNGSATVPSYADPDIGSGYVKKVISGTNDYSGTKQQCTDDIYMDLLRQYCQANSASTQWEVAFNGTHGCAASGCVYHSCAELTTQ